MGVSREVRYSQAMRQAQDARAASPGAVAWRLANNRARDEVTPEFDRRLTEAGTDPQKVLTAIGWMARAVEIRTADILAMTATRTDCFLCTTDLDEPGVEVLGHEVHASCAATGETDEGALAEADIRWSGRNDLDEYMCALGRAYEWGFPHPLTPEAARIAATLAERANDAAADRRCDGGY